MFDDPRDVLLSDDVVFTTAALAVFTGQAATEDTASVEEDGK